MDAVDRRISMNSRPLPFLIVVLLTAGSLGCAKARAQQVQRSAEPGIAVTTTVVQSRPVAQAEALTGTLIANRKSEVAADATGKVAATLVERGAVVAGGAALVRLDRRAATMAEEEATAQAEAARTQQSLAERECARADKLWADGAINGAEHDRARAQCDGARLQATAAAARARLANKNLGDAVVRAPFRGLVADRYVSDGEYVRPDTRVVSLVEVDPLRLELSVPESAVRVLRDAAEVEFQVVAYPGQTFRGKIRYIGPAVRRQSRDLIVEAVVANPERRLLPGMFATAQLITGTHSQPVIPETAIKHEHNVDRAYVVVGDHVEERLLALGPKHGGGVVVLSGLAVGERLIPTLTPELRDGARVR
jgi:membrane fusion protein, multidrug efflux system